MEYIVRHEGGKQPSGTLQWGLLGLINREGLALCPCPSILCKVLNYWSQIPLWTECSPSMSDCLLSVWIFVVISSLHGRWDSKMRSCHEREFDLGRRKDRAGQDKIKCQPEKNPQHFWLDWTEVDECGYFEGFEYICAHVFIHSHYLCRCHSGFRSSSLQFSSFLSSCCNQIPIKQL